jgi:hypothetical protein
MAVRAAARSAGVAARLLTSLARVAGSRAIPSLPAIALAAVTSFGGAPVREASTLRPAVSAASLSPGSIASARPSAGSSSSFSGQLASRLTAAIRRFSGVSGEVAKAARRIALAASPSLRLAASARWAALSNRFGWASAAAAAGSAGLIIQSL